jgi:gliding motility-associated-like protein
MKKHVKIKFLALSAMLLFSSLSWGQIPTQQWITILNESTGSNDLMQGGYSKFPLELSPNESKIALASNFGNQPATSVLNTNDGTIVFSNSQTVNAYSRDVVFEDNDSVHSLSTGPWSPTGDAFVSKYDATGNIIFTNTFNNFQNDYAVTLRKNNNLFVFNTLNRSSGTSNLSHSVYCYNSQGVQQWQSVINDYDWFYGYEGRMTIDLNNNVIFSGKKQTTTNPNTYDVVIRKINSAGVQIWQSYFDQSNLMDHITGRSLITDANGDVYFADANSNNWSGTTFRMVKMSGIDGSILYNKLIGNTQVTDFSFLNNGNLIVGLVNEVRCYNPTTGLIIWSQPYSNINSVKTDFMGNILVSTTNGVHVLDNIGNLQYTLNVSIPGFTTNHIFSISDSNGAIYVVGYRTLGGTNKVFVSKFLNCSNSPSILVNDIEVCEGQIATLTALPSQDGGIYSWSTGESSQSISLNNSGIYTVTYSLIPGCTPAIDSATVIINPAPTLTVNNDTICEGGSLILTAIPSQTGGNYLWSTGEVTQSINPNASGQYTVTYSMGAGCIPVSATGITFINPNPLVNLFNSFECGMDSSSIIVSNDSLANFNFFWSTGETTSSINVNTSGNYNLTITDTLGCSSTDSIFVSIINPEIITQETAFCLGDSTLLTVNNNLSIWWSDGTTNQNSIQVQPTQTTTYSVTVSDGVGTCTDSITIQVNNPQINAGSDLSVCEGETATLTATGADTYVWDNGVVNGQPFTPIIDGYYTVTGTDTLGCSNTVSVFLDVLQPTSSTISPVSCDTYTAPDNEVYTNPGQYTAIIPNTAGCDSTITINLTVNNSNSGTDSKTACDSYTWIDGNTYTASTNSPTFTLQNANGCDSVITLNLTINKLQGLNAGNDIAACQGDNITLTASGATTYSWTGGAANGVAFVPPTGTTIYTVTGTDDNGCTATDAVSVLVEYCLDIPGGISPNGDNANDTWTITGLNQYPDAKVLVFDRWGQKVFSGDATNPTWNGTYEGKELPTADYYYIIELGNGEKFNGVVTLKR